jgi:hypothetical protein
MTAMFAAPPVDGTSTLSSCLAHVLLAVIQVVGYVTDIAHMHFRHSPHERLICSNPRSICLTPPAARYKTQSAHSNTASPPHLNRRSRRLHYTASACTASAAGCLRAHCCNLIRCCLTSPPCGELSGG